MTDANQGDRRTGGARASQTLLVMAACLALVPAASATPTATFAITVLPIPGFPGTGNILGSGAEVEAQVTISGTEYGGSPSPLTGIDLYTPAGVKLTPKGFAYCTTFTLEEKGSAGCPRGSSAGPTGEGLGAVTFGDERVLEKVSIRPFFAPAGGLTFLVEGSTPVSLQILEQAVWLKASAPFGSDLSVTVPLIETLPGADDASVLSFKVKVGAAYRRGSRTVSYITLPRSCPKGGAPLRLELKFLSGETVTVGNKQPCPKRR